MDTGRGADTPAPRVAAPRGPVAFDDPNVAPLLAGSWLCMAGAVVLSDVPPGEAGSRVLWILIGSLLLWRVHRRSRSAWTIAAIVSFFGATLFAIGAPTNGWDAVMCALYLGSGVPLLTRTVRRHLAPPEPTLRQHA